jgi:hypothetical protein
VSDRVRFTPHTVEMHYPRDDPRTTRSSLDTVTISGPAVLIGEMAVDQGAGALGPATFGRRAASKVPLRITLTTEEEHGIDQILRRVFDRYRRDLRAALASTGED